MSFPRYPAYKDSQVEWVGDVPEGWAVCALNYRYDVALGKMLDEKRITGNHLAPYLRNVDVQWGRINIDDLPEMDFSGNDIARYRLDAGDLLVCEGGEVGRAAMWRGAMPECYYQKALHRVRPKNKRTDNPAFLYYILAAAASRSIFAESGGKSTIAHLTAEAFRRYRFAFPPKSDQTAIATFLDSETAKIDALVVDYRTLIELLQEKREAVISHAVTKGLDSTVPMKDSGVKWLGEVPEHWEIVALSRVTTSRCDGPFGTAIKSEHYKEDGARVIRLQNIRAGRFDGADAAFLDLDYFKQELFDHDVVGGDLLVAGLGDENNQVGRACVAPDNLGVALVKADCFRFRLDKDSASADYMAMLLSVGAGADGGFYATGSTRQRIPLSVTGRRRVALPPLSEQSAIAAFVGRETAALDSLIADAQEAIALLQERRTALISAAVTGKIDVRPLVQQKEEAA